MMMNRIRNIVVAAATIFLVVGCLAVVFYRTRGRPDLYTFPHIRLPVAPAFRIDGPGHHNFMIGVDKNGHLDIRDAAVSKDQLAAILAARKKKRGEFPVLIGADARTDFADVWRVVQICRAAGLPHTGFVVAAKPGQQGLWTLDFMPTPEDRDMAELDGVIHVSVSATGFWLNGTAVEPETLERQLVRVAAYSRRVPIWVTVNGGIKHDGVIRVLRMCAKAALLEIGIERMESVQVGAGSDGSETANE